MRPGVRRAQEKNMIDPDRGQRLSRLDLAYLSQCAGLLVTDEVLARVTAGGDDNGDAPVLVEDGLGEVARYRRLVIRVWRDDEDIDFEPRIERWVCGRLLRFGNW